MIVLFPRLETPSSTGLKSPLADCGKRPNKTYVSDYRNEIHEKTIVRRSARKAPDISRGGTCCSGAGFRGVRCLRL